MGGFMHIWGVGWIQTAVLLTILTLCLTAVFLAAKRLFFHPLSEFPGPRVASITSYYKTYFEVCKRGGLLREIDCLHSIYGPIIRIGPNELHFNDCHAYFDIYSVGSHLTKDPTFYSCFGVNSSAFGAIDPQVSKARRGLMHSVLSRRAVLNLEGLIHHKAEILVAKLNNAQRFPVDVFLAFRSASLDIITSYMFGHCFDTLNYQNFEAPLIMDIQAALPLLWVVKSFPWTITVLSIIPKWLGGRLSEQFYAFLSIREAAISLLDRTRKESDIRPDSTRCTIYHHLSTSSDKASESERQSPNPHSILDESLSLLQAGSDTVGNTCTVGTFHVLNNHAVCSRLFEELRSIWPDQTESISLLALQNSPYLTAVIKEALRLSHGIVTPLPRIVGPTGATLSGYHIPPKTIVGMSVIFVHLNPILFPDPEVFNPDRWLDSSSHELGRYLVPFSAGPRMCLGMSIAWAELYFFFAHIFRKLDMQAVEASVGDFRSFQDYFVPLHEGRHLHVHAAPRY